MWCGVGSHCVALRCVAAVLYRNESSRAGHIRTIFSNNYKKKNLFENPKLEAIAIFTRMHFLHPQTYVSQDGVTLMATATSQVRHAPHG